MKVRMIFFSWYYAHVAKINDMAANSYLHVEFCLNKTQTKNYIKNYWVSNLGT